MLVSMAFCVMPRMVVIMRSVVFFMLVGMNMGIAGMRMFMLVLVKVIVDVVVGVLVTMLYPIRMGMFVAMDVLVPVSMDVAVLMFSFHDNASFLQNPFSFLSEDRIQERSCQLRAFISPTGGASSEDETLYPGAQTIGGRYLNRHFAGSHPFPGPPILIWAQSQDCSLFPTLVAAQQVRPQPSEAHDMLGFQQGTPDFNPHYFYGRLVLYHRIG
jgi:hypothetical protein